MYKYTLQIQTIANIDTQKTTKICAKYIRTLLEYKKNKNKQTNKKKNSPEIFNIAKFEQVKDLTNRCICLNGKPVCI